MLTRFPELLNNAAAMLPDAINAAVSVKEQYSPPKKIAVIQIKDIQYIVPDITDISRNCVLMVMIAALAPKNEDIRSVNMIIIPA